MQHDFDLQHVPGDCMFRQADIPLLVISDFDDVCCARVSRRGSPLRGLTTETAGRFRICNDSVS